MADQDPNKPGESPFEITSLSVGEALRRRADESRTAEPQPAAAPRVTLGESLDTAPAAPAKPEYDFSLGRPGYLDRAVFCRQFATLVEVGIPVLKALKMLADRTPHSKLRAAVRETAQGVEQGQPIHQSMAKNIAIFSPLVVNIVRVGEVGGMLEESLHRLAEIMESKAKIKRQVVAASMYPVVALIVAFAAIVIIMTGPIPAFEQVYDSTGRDLPGLTQVMVGVSHFFVNFWILLVILGIVGFFALRIWGATPGGQRFSSIAYMRTPVLRGVNRKINAARFTRTMGGLLRAGVPLAEALRITADSSENVLVADALREVQLSVSRGERMAPQLQTANVFPEILVDMVAIGEETGTLDQMLGRVADIYEGEVDSTLAGLTSIIEPLLIVLLGGVVIFIALALLLPYFNMVSVVGVN